MKDEAGIRALIERFAPILTRLTGMVALANYWSPEALPFPVALPSEGARGCGEQPPPMSIEARDLGDAAQAILDLSATLEALLDERAADREALRLARRGLRQGADKRLVADARRRTAAALAASCLTDKDAQP